MKINRVMAFFGIVILSIGMVNYSSMEGVLFWACLFDMFIGDLLIVQSIEN